MAGPFAIDASIFLNAFNPLEKGSEISKEMLARLQSQAVPLIAPTLLLPETAAAISRVQNNPDLARKFALTLKRLPHLVLLPLDQILAQQALELGHYAQPGRHAQFALRAGHLGDNRDWLAGRFCLAAFRTVFCHWHDRYL